ncbi:hypothetical protein [Streptomyces sp. NPDC058252]|uniref:hypothetical protein n=1 Tax=Streptomyces sp. NPDC058252 TaxID=3346405 RepID=UPI0036E31B2D
MIIPPELNGATIPGGCDDCTAEQGLAEVQPGIWTLNVRHDATCPTWRRIQQARGGSS